MRDARSVYLGYGNSTRRAVAISGHDVVVLMRGQQYTVLEGADAVAFLRDVSEVTHHICGVRHSARIEARMRTIGSTQSNRVYESVFDEYHHHA